MVMFHCHVSCWGCDIFFTWGVEGSCLLSSCSHIFHFTHGLIGGWCWSVNGDTYNLLFLTQLPNIPNKTSWSWKLVLHFVRMLAPYGFPKSFNSLVVLNTANLNPSWHVMFKNHPQVPSQPTFQSQQKKESSNTEWRFNLALVFSPRRKKPGAAHPKLKPNNPLLSQKTMK